MKKGLYATLANWLRGFSPSSKHLLDSCFGSTVRTKSLRESEARCVWNREASIRSLKTFADSFMLTYFRKDLA
jgi:hypothetical protein